MFPPFPAFSAERIPEHYVRTIHLAERAGAGTAITEIIVAAHHPLMRAALPAARQHLIRFPTHFFPPFLSL